MGEIRLSLVLLQEALKPGPSLQDEHQTKGLPAAHANSCSSLLHRFRQSSIASAGLRNKGPCPRPVLLQGCSFLRPLKVSTGSAQGQRRVSTESAQGPHRVDTGSAQVRPRGRRRVSTRSAQGQDGQDEVTTGSGEGRPRTGTGLAKRGYRVGTESETDDGHEWPSSILEAGARARAGAEVARG